MFRRTISGLKNQHIFEDVEMVVFVEGGDKVAASADIIFWRSVFLSVFPGRRFSFKARGSKTFLSGIAKEIRDVGIGNVAVAMDRDYDGFNDVEFNCANVVYTKGYSWENDLVSSSIYIDAFRNCACVDNVREDFLQSMISDIKKFERVMTPVVRFDIIFTRGGEPIIHRNVTGGGILSAKKGNIKIDKSIISRRVKYACASGLCVKSAKRISVRAVLHGYGHFVSAFFYRLFVRSLAVLGRNKSVSYDHFCDVMLSLIPFEFARDVETSFSRYYKEELSSKVVFS